MRRWIFIFLVFVIALVYSISVQSQINSAQGNSEVQELFGNNEEAEVIVVLKDDYNVLQGYGIKDYNEDGFQMKKMMIHEQQEGVLSNLKLKKNKDTKKLPEPIFSSDEDYELDLTNTYATVNGFAGKLKKGSYEKLRNNPKVLRIIKSGTKNLVLDGSVPLVNATNAWRLIYAGMNITGKGETVCIVDSGIDYTHPSLGGCTNDTFLAGNCSKVIAGYDFKNNDTNPIDDQGHGTHVAGIIASTNETYRGVAPEATLVAIKVCDNSSGGNCNDKDIVSGIDWCVNNASKYNISVISMSLGGGSFTTYCDDESSESAFKIAIDNAIARNISVVVASGNGNPGNTTAISSPACLRNSTAVGSVTKADAISSFSNRNNITDLLAPGSSIKSTVPRSGCINCDSSGFLTLSGTSMSTPHVAGAFALLRQYRRLERNTILTPLQMQNALNSTGKQISDSGSGLTFSRINIFSALLSLDTTAPNITFVAPTPANGTNLSLNSTDFFVYINASTTEVLPSAILEINNGTKKNISMTINALNSFINLTALKVGVITFRIYGNDSSGNSNITDTRVFQINNTAPNIIAFAPSNESANINEPNNSTFSINFSDNENDSVTFYWYLNNSLQISGINKSEFNFTGNFTSAGFYIINATLDDGILKTFKSWNLTVTNTNFAPNITSVNLTNADFLNRTNGTLQAFFSFTDIDGDGITANETLWFVNNSLITNYTNKTFIHPLNTTKLENWTFSVRVFDGTNWSNFVNSTTIKILNAKPSINITTLSLTVLETQLANISLNASDFDNDALIFASNKSDFLISNNYLLWHTNLTSSGIYTTNITVNDSLDIDSAIVNVTILDARDLDNDGNPDFNDTDIDNDGIPNENDYLEGNLSSINTTISLNITINGTSNLSKLFNGTFTINVTNGSDEILEFNFTFNSSNVLDLGNLTINRTTNGSSAVAIRGLHTIAYETIFLEKANATAKSVCIKDDDIGFDAISSTCDSANETLLNCNNATSGQYTCFDTGTRYKITGLSHSAVKEQCRDNDGDGYGTGCAAGNDCNDNDRSKTTDCSTPASSGGSSGGSGGGGGGGGGSIGFVCSMDWKCNEWSACVNGLQTRQCDFVKVPQHSQDAECPSLSSSPATSQKCEMQISEQLKAAEKATETCNDKIKNQNEEGIDCGGVCKPCSIEKNFEKQNIATSQITGQSITNVPRGNIYLGLGILFLISSILFYAKFSHGRLFRKNDK